MNQRVNKNQNILRKFLPVSVLSDVNCFVLYDHHPMDQRQLDITICTKCEVREYFQRELISSIQVHNASNITIVRNSKCVLYYLVHCHSEVFILSSIKGHIAIHKHLTSVISWTMEDYGCNGKVYLKITLEDNFCTFNDNFDIVETEFTFNQPSLEPEESSSLVHQLDTKLTEAMYITKCNEKTLDEYVKIRQLAAFSMYQKETYESGDYDINLSIKRVASALKVETKEPTVKLCNKKIIVILNIGNRNAVLMENVHILLHGSSLHSKCYKTRLFKKISTSPHYKEIDSQIESNSKVVAIAVIDLEELKYNVTSRLDFDVVLSYKMNDEINLLPFESVSISAIDTMGKNFDILADNECISDNIVLAVIATSQKVYLKLRHVKSDTEANVIPSDIFHKYLEMSLVPNFKNVAIHNESPFHILHGIMVFYDRDPIQEHTINIELYTRQPSQALALIHYMQEKVPHRIITTPMQFKLKPIIDEYNLLNLSEELDVTFDYSDYASSIMKQIDEIQHYLLECQAKIKENGTNTEKIDLRILGADEYLKFRQLLKTLLMRNKIINQINKKEHVVHMEE